MKAAIKKNYGLNLELERQHVNEKTDWVYGALSAPCITDIPAGERNLYLPKGEIQNKGEDKFDCASRGPLNILETKFTWLLRNKKLLPENEAWLRANGYVVVRDGLEWIEFSDCFVAQNSGTVPGLGNSLIKPLDAIHNAGLIPKALLPQIESAAEYYDPKRITPQMIGLGLEFKRRFTINYERVNAVHYAYLLQEDLLNVAGHAWPTPKKGEYPMTDEAFNHCFILFNLPAFLAFDNYIDSVDGDFIKKLAKNFKFLDYGYRVYIASQVPQKKRNWLADFFKSLYDVWLKPVFKR